MGDTHLSLCDARINSSQILILTIGVLVEGAAVLALGFGASQYATYRKCVKICSLKGEEKDVAMKHFFKPTMARWIRKSRNANALWAVDASLSSGIILRELDAESL